ncbi:hypothetical protein PENSPDRAFT_320127 [Peniophora sp. CONT]|nr:hypothetical protein PENSPDRAFT_320127 [Peniophora sp. CONT]
MIFASLALYCSIVLHSGLWSRFLKFPSILSQDDQHLDYLALPVLTLCLVYKCLPRWLCSLNENSLHFSKLQPGNPSQNHAKTQESPTRWMTLRACTACASREHSAW